MQGNYSPAGVKRQSLLWGLGQRPKIENLLGEQADGVTHNTEDEEADDDKQRIHAFFE